MHLVEIYSHPGCVYCHQAKALLQRRGINYQEHDVAHHEHLLEEMIVRTGGRTFPQILIQDRAIGGFDALHRIDSNGELQILLQQHPG